MMSIALRYSNDEDTATDIVNTAFIKVLGKLSTYDKGLPFKPWAQRITLNQALDRFRQKKRRNELMIEADDGWQQIEGSQQLPENTDWVEAEYLQSLINELKETEKTIFNLFAIDGYSHKEIGNMLGITERSSIRHLTNARRKLQQLILLEQPGVKKA